MKTIKIIDMTLRETASMKEATLSFKEKLEMARCLDRVKADVIELAPIADGKADQLANKTIASMVNTVVSATCGMTVESVEEAWESIRNAKHPKLHIMTPVSPVQMEYACHKKAPAMMEMIVELVKKCRFFCENVAFSAIDATRAEKDFLYKLIAAVIESGAKSITLCDNAGIMMPDEFAAFIADIKANVPAINDVELYVQVSDEMHMAIAVAAAAIAQGVDGVKCTATACGYPTLEEIAHFIQIKGSAMDIATNLRATELSRTVKQMQWMLQTRKSESSPFENGVSESTNNICLDANDEIGEVVKVIHQLGYDLSDDDNAKVYEEFKRLAQTKHFVGTRELEAIIASTALQVPTSYRLDSYVINCGNVISASANVTLERDGNKLRSISVGDGPIDAAFLAIEQIIGHHYELDDFQIQTVTEGRGAMGSALVKLRANGKLYSGNGISTDIIGASIRAYVNALNKIVFEEE
ncbi:MAG: hypothetical protein E7337_11000 [Clostridiales bacterium]|nr:hypothetical protein [Clostridiales bacterium]